jgi:hypothetical protein
MLRKDTVKLRRASIYDACSKKSPESASGRIVWGLFASVPAQQTAPQELAASEKNMPERKQEPPVYKYRATPCSVKKKCKKIVKKWKSSRKYTKNSKKTHRIQDISF